MFSFILGATTNFWVGIRRETYSDPFLMLTTPSDPEFVLHSPLWHSGQPNGPSSPPYQNCLNADSPSGFNYHDTNCAKNQPFLCEIPGHKSPTRNYILSV